MEGTMSEIRMFAADFAPKTWAYCQGQTLAINTNQALFALLGTTYGGNGTTTFCLPNLSGRMAMGTGTAKTGVNSYQLGQIDGAASVTLTLANLPAHTHVVPPFSVNALAYSDTGDVDTPDGNTLASVSGLYANGIVPDITMRPATSVVNVMVSGGNQPIPLGQPTLGMNYIICTYGIFPSRN